MRDLTYYQDLVLALVRQHPKADPISGAKIAEKIGMKERDNSKTGADMRAIINALRTKGFPICATGRGYFFPGNRVELENFIRDFQGRVDQQQKAIEGMRRIRADYPNITKPDHDLRLRLLIKQIPLSFETHEAVTEINQALKSAYESLKVSVIKKYEQKFNLKV